jgi:hypothetical protein
MTEAMQGASLSAGISLSPYLRKQLERESATPTRLFRPGSRGLFSTLRTKLHRAEKSLRKVRARLDELL